MIITQTDIANLAALLHLVKIDPVGATVHLWNYARAYGAPVRPAKGGAR